MTKHILVCADDYGETLPISQAILALVSAKRLTAVSCMVNGHDWREHAARLQPLINDIDVGLHFNLTQGEALSPVYRAQYGATFASLSQMLLKSQLRMLKETPIQAEFDAQWQAFTCAMGRPPDFVDGHQHVHQFPIIREAMVTSLLLQATKPRFVRVVNPSLSLTNREGIKKLIIKLSGTAPLRALLTKHQIAFNPSFTGIYAFSEAHRYRQYAKQFLHEIGEGGLMMCHPGLTNVQAAWPMSRSRPLEYAYLASDAFLDDLQSENVKLTRFQG